MFKKLLTTISLISIVFAGAGSVFAKQTGNWQAVENLGNREIALQKKNGQMIFGRIKSIDSSSLILQIATKQDYTTDEETIPQSEVKKIWQATLRFGDHNARTGALIGGGAGAAAGIIKVREFPPPHPSGTAVIAIPFFAAIGAGAGALVGYFAKKSHKKNKLIYSV